MPCARHAGIAWGRGEVGRGSRGQVQHLCSVRLRLKNETLLVSLAQTTRLHATMCLGAASCLVGMAKVIVPHAFAVGHTWLALPVPGARHAYSPLCTSMDHDDVMVQSLLTRPRCMLGEKFWLRAGCAQVLYVAQPRQCHESFVS